jgi:hypothetical protein
MTGDVRDPPDVPEGVQVLHKPVPTLDLIACVDTCAIA